MTINSDSRSSALVSWGRAAIISSLLVLPFLILQWANRARFFEDFPLVLFAVLWLLPFGSILLSRAIANTRAPKGAAALLLVLVASFWIVLVIDQMPCFLGVPNCD